MVTHFQLKHHVYAFNDSNTSIHDSFKSTRNSIQLAEKKGKKKKHTGLSIMKCKQKTKLRASLNYGRKIMSMQVQISKFCKCVHTLVQNLMQKKGEKHHIEEQHIMTTKL